MGPAGDGELGVQLRLEAAVAMAHEVGPRADHYFRAGMLTPEAKLDGSPVTIADREAEQELRRAIAAAFPEDGVLGEEFGETRGTSGGGGYRWILDPIDGTKSFIRGVPLWGMLIAVEYAGRSVAGVIHMPALDEMVYAREGGGAWHVVHGEVRPARVSAVDSLGEALVCTTSLSYAMRRHESEFAALAKVCRSIRGWSDCYAHLLVATGRAEAAIEPLINIWDVAPMIPIMREAGGQYTDWDGNETATSPTGLSSNGCIHEGLLSMLRASAAGVD
jgi:histidinol-phosphatase